MNRHEALHHAILAHDGERDKNGLPVILHPVEVARKVAFQGERFEVAALLHDVFEDTDYPLERYLNADEASDLAALTHEPGESYLGSYIPRVCQRQVGRFVKLADLHSNMNRPAIPNEPTRIGDRRGRKYLEARRLIWEAAPNVKWWPDVDESMAALTRTLRNSS